MRRSPVRRPRKPPITPEAVELFKRTRELKDVIRNAPNSPAADEYRVISRRLRLMFDLKLWNEFVLMEPVDPDAVHPADRNEFARIDGLRRMLEEECSK
jgi:hypothetical protein